MWSGGDTPWGHSPPLGSIRMLTIERLRRSCQSRPRESPSPDKSRHPAHSVPALKSAHSPQHPAYMLAVSPTSARTSHMHGSSKPFHSPSCHPAKLTASHHTYRPYPQALLRAQAPCSKAHQANHSIPSRASGGSVLLLLCLLRNPHRLHHPSPRLAC